MTTSKEVAALIVNSMVEQSDVGGYVRTGVHEDGTPDLTDVCIDGFYDLEAIAEAIMFEITGKPNE